MAVLIGITIALIFYPRADPSATSSSNDFDQIFAIRTVLLVILGVSLVAGIIAVLVLHWAEPIYATPLRKPTLNR